MAELSQLCSSTIIGNLNSLPIHELLEIQSIFVKNKLDLTPIKLLLLQDLSGSQNHWNYRHENPNRINGNNPVLKFINAMMLNPLCSLFGFGGTSEAEYNIFNPGKQWSNNIVGFDNKFNNELFGSTSTMMIDTALKAIDQTKKFCLVFQGDGSFNGNKTFTQVLRENIHLIQNAAMLIIVFSEWTAPVTQQQLFQEISALIESVASAMPPPIRFVMDSRDCNNPITAQKVLEIIPKSGYVLARHQYDFESFVLDRTLTPRTISRIVKHWVEIGHPHGQLFIDEAVNLLISTILVNSKLLNIEGNIYQTLHATLRTLQDCHVLISPANLVLIQAIDRLSMPLAEFCSSGYKTVYEGYINLLSIINQKKNDPEIKRLIIESQNSTQEFIDRLDNTRSCSRSGKLILNLSADTLKKWNFEAVTRAVKDFDGTQLHKIFRLLLESYIFSGDMSDELAKNELFCPDVNNDPKTLMQFIEILFAPLTLGENVSVLTSKLAIDFAMFALSEDIEICIQLHEIFERIIHECIRTGKIYTHFGFSKTANSSELIENIKETWFAYSNAKFLFRFIKLFESHLELNSSMIRRLTNIWQIIRLNSVFFGYKKKLQIARRSVILVDPITNNDELKVGSVCQLHDHTWYINGANPIAGINGSECPWKSIPAIVHIIRIHMHEGKKIYLCEYFDRPFNTDDHKTIDARHLRDVLSFSALPKEIESEINQYLITERQADSVAAGSYSDTKGVEFRKPVCDGAVPRNVELHAARLERVCSLTRQHNGVGQLETDLSIQIPLEIIYDILGLSPAIRKVLELNKPSLSKAIICEFIDSDSNFSDIISRLTAQLSNNFEPIAFNDGLISSSEILGFIKSFLKILIDVPIKGSIQKLQQCLCQDVSPNFVLEGGYQLTCGHVYCRECYQNSIPHYEHGDFIDPCRHRCAFNCLNSRIEPPEAVWWCVPINSVNLGMLKRPRFCSVQSCTTIFAASEGGCAAAMDDSQLPDKCEHHRDKQFDNYPCPGCNTYLQHGGGCAQITCCRYGSDGCSEHCTHGGLCGTIFCRWCKEVYSDGSWSDNKWACYGHTHGCHLNPVNSAVAHQDIESDNDY
jgi:hypothetical protein